MNCPIYNRLIVEDKDILITKFYPPKEWWVTEHYVLEEDNTKEHFIFIKIGDKRYKQFCGQADIQTVTTESRINELILNQKEEI